MIQIINSDNYFDKDLDIVLHDKNFEKLYSCIVLKNVLYDGIEYILIKFNSFINLNILLLSYLKIDLNIDVNINYNIIKRNNYCNTSIFYKIKDISKNVLYFESIKELYQNIYYNIKNKSLIIQIFEIILEKMIKYILDLAKKNIFLNSFKFYLIYDNLDMLIMNEIKDISFIYSISNEIYYDIDFDIDILNEVIDLYIQQKDKKNNKKYIQNNNISINIKYNILFKKYNTEYLFKNKIRKFYKNKKTPYNFYIKKFL
uniref:Uncharacterized protein n=1 Tax=Pithovirus LCDPAC02 TaxID=2506601 RepID=A0A481YQR7_9VIRU|nr:MAG: hypothetical protein LCDPAC02_00030 [Pithovirus LCDPAC02]